MDTTDHLDGPHDKPVKVKLAVPPYPACQLEMRGGHVMAPGKHALHPCMKTDWCTGETCKWRCFPSPLCWDFAKSGYCGRNYCNCVHAVETIDGQIFVFDNKKMKLNDAVSRSEAKAAVHQKVERMVAESQRRRKREREESEHADILYRKEISLVKAKTLAALSEEEIMNNKDKFLDMIFNSEK